MLYNSITAIIVGLHGLIINEIKNIGNKIIIYAEMKRKEHLCVSFGIATDAIYDYRTQEIKDIAAFGKNVVIVLQKRRYRCSYCGKSFLGETTFLPRDYRMTNRLVSFVLSKLIDECFFTSVAKEINLSVSTVISIFDLISYPKAILSNGLSVDKFNGNTNGEKYPCILTVPVNQRVLDILPERYKPYLTR